MVIRFSEDINQIFLLQKKGMRCNQIYKEYENNSD